MSRNWQSLYDKITGLSRSRSTPKKPTSVVLDRFEDRSGIAFPAAYQEFILVFGAGQLLLTNKEGVEVVRFEFWCPECDGPQYDMTENNLTVQEMLDSDDYPEQLTRCCFFGEYASSKSGYISGDYLGWDCASSASPEADYSVHLLPRDQHTSLMIAPSFRQFLEVACFDNVWIDPITHEALEICQRHFDPALPLS